MVCLKSNYTQSFKYDIKKKKRKMRKKRKKKRRKRRKRRKEEKEEKEEKISLTLRFDSAGRSCFHNIMKLPLSFSTN